MIDSVPSNKGASTFCSAVNCIDGRVQLPVIQYLTRWFHVDFVDIVSDTGPVGVLAHNPDTDRAASIYRQIDVSRNAHKSHGLAIVATTIVPENQGTTTGRRSLISRRPSWQRRRPPCWSSMRPHPSSLSHDRWTQGVRERWNDYGIGLLLQGNLRGAEAAFRTVMAIDPTYPDGPVNVARARLQEGDVDAAIPLLEQALALEPSLAARGKSRAH